MNAKKTVLFSKIDSVDSARTIARYGAYLSFGQAVFTATFIGLAVTNTYHLDATLGWWNLADVLVLANLGLFVFRMSRAAAVLLVLYSLSDLAMAMLTPHAGIPWVAVIITLIYVGALRACFAYPQLQDKAIARAQMAVA